MVQPVVRQLILTLPLDKEQVATELRAQEEAETNVTRQETTAIQRVMDLPDQQVVYPPI